MRIGFRRATHDWKTGEYLTGEFAQKNLSDFQKKVWEAHGDIAHLLDSGKSMSYTELLEEIRKDFTNYLYESSDLQGWRDGSLMPTPEEVALSLVRLLEAGFIKMDPILDRKTMPW